jgi:hypothetical protein
MVIQRQTFSVRARFGKWAGFFFGTLAALADQQIISTSVYARCPEQSAAFVVSIGAVCALIGLIGAAMSFRVRQSLPKEQTASAALRADRFIATLAGAFALFCVLFIIFATPAGMILGCER